MQKKFYFGFIVIFFLVLASACLLAFILKPNSSNAILSSSHLQTNSDSLQYFALRYEELRNRRDSVLDLISEFQPELKENNKKIAAQKKRQEDLKVNRAWIFKNSTHKAKTQADKKDIIRYDSLIASSEAATKRMESRNEFLNYNLLALVEKDSIISKYFVTFHKDLLRYTSKIHGSRVVRFQDVTYHLFVVDLDSDDVRMHLFNAEDQNKNFSSIENVKKHLAKKKLQPLMITNGGMYLSNLQPEGLYVENQSTTFFPLNIQGARPDANFYLMPNGVFYLDANNKPHITTTENLMSYNVNDLRKFKAATQSGPMLVIDGDIHPAFMPNSKNSKVRSGVGIPLGQSRKIVFAITTDGTNFYDFALFFRDLFHCDQALYLDGVVSQMYLADLAPEVLGGNFGAMISVVKKNSK